MQTPTSGPRRATALDVAERLAAGLVQLFRGSRGDSLTAMVRAAHGEAERRIAAAAERTACLPGCAFCCHQQVSATGAEILNLARRISRLKPPERAARRAAIRRAAAATRGLDPVRRWALRQPCPLLGPDRLCTAYEDRPFGCRGYASRDVESCRQAFESAETSSPAQIPRPEATRLNAVMLSAALDKALQHLALPHHPYDLIHGLDIVLDMGVGPATQRYLRGEDILEPARIVLPAARPAVSRPAAAP